MEDLVTRGPNPSLQVNKSISCVASEAAKQTEKAPPRYVCRKNADCSE